MAMLSHTREWLTNLGARYPPGLVLDQLTAPTPGVRHALHRASALTEQLTDKVLDLALEPLRVLYPQTHIPPAGTFNRLGRLGLQRRVKDAHPGGVVEQWLTLRNPSPAQGHWYLHQLLFLPRAAPEHRRQNPYHTRPERLGAQSFPQPAPPALSPGQGPEALQQDPPLDTATRVQQRGSNGADGAELDSTNCGAVAWTAACRQLARDTTGLTQYRPTDRTALASAVAAVTIGRVPAWPAQLLPHVPCRDTQPRQLAATHRPTAPLTAEQLYVVAAALLGDGKESFVHHHGPAQIAGSIQGPQHDAPHPVHATLRGRSRVRDAGGGTPPPGTQQEEALVLQTAGYQAILHGHAGGYRSHVLTGRRWTVWHGTARQGAFQPQPHVDWQQGPNQAYYMTADPWPLAVLLHTVSAPNKRQEPGWVNPPALVWSPNQDEHLRAAWQAQHQGTKQERRKPRDTKGEGGGRATTKEQPTAKRDTQTRRERTESQAAGGREKQPTGNGNSSERERGNPSPEGAKQSRKTKRPREKVRRTRTRPGGRPARPGQAKHAHEHKRTPAAVRKDECAPSHNPTNTPPPHTTHQTPHTTAASGPQHGVAGTAHHQRQRNPARSGGE